MNANKKPKQTSYSGRRKNSSQYAIDSIIDREEMWPIYLELQEEDEATAKLFEEVYDRLGDELEMPPNVESALKRFRRLISRGTGGDVANARNQIFKIAHELKIKLPHYHFNPVARDADDERGINLVLVEDPERYDGYARHRLGLVARWTHYPRSGGNIEVESAGIWGIDDVDLTPGWYVPDWLREDHGADQIAEVVAARKEFAEDFFNPSQKRRFNPSKLGDEVTAQDFAPGEAVQVHAFGNWYHGTVVSIGRSKVKVNYTSGTGANRDKNVGMDKIRKSG